MGNVDEIGLGDGENVRAQVGRQVRATYGAEVAACEHVGEYVVERTVPWPGRLLDDDRADPIIVGEFARARKTYSAAVHLVLGGFGPQAAMLNRSLFEGMAVAHWVHANPDLAWDRFQRHERHNELLWGDTLTGVGWVKPDQIDRGTKEERDELGDLFGPYGERLWTGHTSVRKIVADIEDQWPEGRPREELWEFLRVSHRDNNQVLHSTVTALLGGARSDEDSISFDSVPSSYFLPRALLGALWCYAQTVTLVWDHFEFDGRDELDVVLMQAREPFVTVDPAVAQHTGRNDPCPCGSGRKYKRCHGA